MPLLKPLQAKELSALLQPAGSAVRLLVSCKAVAGPAIIGRERDGNGWVPMPTTALIWPDGDGVATALSLVVAA